MIMIIAGVIFLGSVVSIGVAANGTDTTTTTTAGGTIAEEPLMPRNQVKSGALSSRRPGNWVNQGISNFKEHQTTALDKLGGASAISESQRPDSTPFLHKIEIQAIEGVFEKINGLIELLKYAIENGMLQPSPTPQPIPV